MSAALLAAVQLMPSQAQAAVSTVSILSSTSTPAITNAADTRPVALGVRFTTSQPGTITAIKFYQGSGNEGPHTGTLWSSSGQALATATFPAASGSGWRTATLTRPVDVVPDRTYVASYVAPAGHYSLTTDVFSNGRSVSNPPLTASAGVYSYDLGFPQSSWRGTSYFVDVVFTAESGGDSDPAPAAPADPVTGSTEYPQASNTGVPSGVTLTKASGMTISKSGVYDSLDIAGTVEITASNVTLRRSRVIGNGYSIVRVKSGLTGVRIEDCEIGGRGQSGDVNSGGINGPATMVRNDIHSVENGIVPASGSVIQDNWIHGLSAPDSPHYDGLQLDGGQSNVKISHNTVDMREWDQTSAVMIDNYFGSINNITVDNNRLLGGGYTTYSDGSFNGGSINNVSYTNNRIGGGYWGYALIRNNSGFVWSGNVDDASNKLVSAR